MRALRVVAVMACFAAWAGPVRGETKEPFHDLFTPDPIVSAEPLPASVDQVHPVGEAPVFGAVGDAVLAQQTRKADEPPQHTGFAALVYSTAADFKAFPRRRSTWVILGIGAGAAALAHPADDSVNERLVGSDAVGKFFAPGKYIGSFYAQLGTATALYVVGRYVLPRTEGEPKTNKVSHMGFDMVRALVVSQAFTQAVKYAVRRDRPTGECCAFPSGHASAAFATASVLERHFGYRGAWPTFVVASYVAASRLHDNRHFLSDVLFGSALGIASGWTVVGRHGRSDYSMMPIPTQGGMMIAFTRNSRSAMDPRP